MRRQRRSVFTYGRRLRIVWGICHLLVAFYLGTFTFMRLLFCYLMSLVYIVAGINHFINPAMYRSIMPPWLPWHRELVLISGVLEVVLGVLLLFPGTRVPAAWGIILLLIAVFPANIQMALQWWRESHPYLWAALLRLPLQGLLIWWAYTYTKQ